MGYHGSYHRKIRDNNETIRIHRLCCKDKSCRHTEAILPNFLLPRKQYSANEIEAVMMDANDAAAEQIDTKASVSTIRRWIKYFSEEIIVWIGILTQSSVSTCVKSKTEKVSLQEDVYSPLERLRLLLRSIPGAFRSGNILGDALAEISGRAFGCPICT